MKSTKCIFLLFTVLIAATTLHAQARSADDMAQKIFTSFQTKDEKAFIALYPNKEQMMGLVKKMMKGVMAELKNSPETMEELKKESNGNIDSLLSAEFEKKASPEEMVKMQEKYTKDFRKWIEEGEKKGVSWSNARITKTEIDTVAENDEAMQKLFGSDQFKSMKGSIHFTSNNIAYQLRFGQVMFLPEENGWFGVKVKQIAKEGEPLTNDDDVEVEEMTEDVEKEVPPPPPSKPKSKVKKKTTTSKTKTKTKS